MIREDIKRLINEGHGYKGLEDCPSCISENNFCFEHQKLQKELEKIGYNTIEINYNLEYL